MRSFDIVVLLSAIICVIVLLNLESAVTLRQRFTIDFHGKDAVNHLPPMVLPSFPSYMEKSSTPHRHLLYVTKGRLLTMHSLKALSHNQKWYVGGQGDVQLREDSIVLEYEIPDEFDLVQSVHYLPETVQFIVLTRSWRILCYNYTEEDLEEEGVFGTLKLIYNTNLLEDNLNTQNTLMPNQLRDKRVQRILSSKIISSTGKLGVHKGDQGITVVAIETEHHHYHYYGLHTVDGEMRWSHEPEDYHFRPKMTHGLFFHHSFDEQHHGEVNWRVFQSDILRQLPHRHRHQHDLALTLDHFHHEKSSKNRMRIEEGGEEEDEDEYEQQQPEETDEVDEELSSSSYDYRKIVEKDWYRNVIVVHQQRGIEVLHLYTGRTLTSFGPLNHDVLYDDVNQDGLVESAKVVLMDSEKGKECHPFIQTGVPTGAQRIKFSNQDDESGFSLCEAMTPIRSFLSIDFVRHQYEMKRFSDICPITIGGHPFDPNRNLLEDVEPKQIIFYMNNGMVTSVSMEETSYMTKNWQVMIPTHYRRPGHHFFEVRGFKLYPDDEVENFILVTGEDSITILDDDGNILDTLRLEVSPYIPLVVSDLTGNGRNDILMVHNEKLVGIVTHVSYSRNNAFTFFLFGFVMFIAAMYISTVVPMNNPLYYQKKK